MRTKPDPEPIPLDPPAGQPPCNGCVRCCKGFDLIRLLPGDDPATYQTMAHPLRPDALALQHKPNGDCVYLAPDGCSIYERRPLMCRSMDCRVVALTITRAQADRLRIPRAYQRGRQLLREQGIIQ